YGKNRIILVWIKLNSLTDLENVENIIKYSSIVFFCNPLLCPNIFSFISVILSLIIGKSFLHQFSYLTTAAKR
ncbi:hypothetical protein, partial [Treponema endosymbiont of Eucomonympha sp.]|uniref:hypothetical protein n=1 Tax=Treponema endosymbiont of Eucomonympha sp. TaxID=1580831 RepID=UPI001EE77C26